MRAWEREEGMKQQQRHGGSDGISEVCLGEISLQPLQQKAQLSKGCVGGNVSAELLEIFHRVEDGEVPLTELGSCVEAISGCRRSNVLTGSAVPESIES